MNRDALLERLAGLEPVDLAELGSVAPLLIRRDRKYVVPGSVAVELVERLADRCRVLEIDDRRRFRYESSYFDTPDHASYLGAARRRPRRFKVRTRSYLDSGDCLLEMKTRDPRGRTVKQRHPHPIEARGRLDPAGRAFVGGCPLIGGQSEVLARTLTTRYSRATLLVGNARTRVTIDVDVEAWTPDEHTVALVGMVIVETKSGGPPSEADRILWSLGYRPTSVSKYCSSLAALRPELPSNKWTRALRQPWLVDGRSETATAVEEALALAG
jgi:hypothetical protein